MMVIIYRRSLWRRDVSKHARICKADAEGSARFLEQRPNESVLIGDNTGTSALQIVWSWLVSKMAKVLGW